jgi:hypothetical protein
LHRDAARRLERVARRERLRHAGDAHFQARGQCIVGTLEHARVGAPCKARWICLDIVDQVEHLPVASIDDGAAANLDHEVYPRQSV